MRRWQKDLMRDLRKLAAQPCAANVFPREKPGCENNGGICASCDAREELDKLVRRSNSLILSRAKAKLLTCGRCGKPVDDGAHVVSNVHHHAFVYGTNGLLTE
jgi:hypothetical protein